MRRTGLFFPASSFAYPSKAGTEALSVWHVEAYILSPIATVHSLNVSSVFCGAMSCCERVLASAHASRRHNLVTRAKRARGLHYPQVVSVSNNTCYLRPSCSFDCISERLDRLPTTRNVKVTGGFSSTSGGVCSNARSGYDRTEKGIRSHIHYSISDCTY